MSRRPFFFSRGSRAALCALLVLASAPSGIHADVASHTPNDSFLAEVTALLPGGNPPVVSLTAPEQRIVLGEWGPLIPWTPHIPVSAASLPDGRILTFASNERTTFPNGLERTFAATWDPVTGQFVEYIHPSHDMFCGGLATLPDGRVLVTGGNVVRETSLFDWRDNSWTRTADMNDLRWYNTAVALPNGRVWTVSGTGGPDTAERWDPVTGWSRQTGIDWNLVTADPGYINIWHPFLLLAPDGRLIHFGPTKTMHWVTTEGSGSLTNAGAVVPGPQYPKESTWVMFDEGQILVAGGGANTDANISNPDTGYSTNAAYTVDVRTGTPVVTPILPMNFVRQFGNGVILPNGEVFVVGGNDSGMQFSDAGWVSTPEIWNPSTGQWRVMATNAVARAYHSIALLLPDGRVLSAGGGLPFSMADDDGNHQDAQLFTPPMLFNPDGSLAARPTLTNAPNIVGVATTFTVSGTPGLAKFSFIKMSAITHSVNTDLRYLSLPFTESAPGHYQIQAHTNLNVMTPGYWMLFGLDAADVYSAARVILVDSNNNVSITSPGNQASYVESAVSLAMTGSGPAGSVKHWSATGLPSGLFMDEATGLIAGTPTSPGTFPVQVTMTDNHTTAVVNFTWIIQPLTLNQNFADFSGATGLTLNSNAVLTGTVLRLTTNVANQVGSAFLTAPVTIGPNTSISTRWVFRAHDAGNGGEGLAFVIQGTGPSAVGGAGNALGYGGLSNSVAVEIDTAQGPGDPNANHLGILTNGIVTAHLATYTPGWDLQDGFSHTVWVEYDGPANLLHVYAAEGIVATRPSNPVVTAMLDLPAIVGGQAWLGWTSATSSSANYHDIESWSVTANAFALPAPPELVGVAALTNVLGYAVNLQLEASDPNGDLLYWSATGLPPGLALNPASGLISGTPTEFGMYAPVISATDSNFPPSSTNFIWTINDLLAIQPLSGPAVVAGTPINLIAQAQGGLNPVYSWNFGDGTPATEFTNSPAATHAFPNPGWYLITVTARDDRDAEVTASYYQAVSSAPTTNHPTASAAIVYESRTNAHSRLWVVNPDNDSVTVFDAVNYAKLTEIPVGRAPHSLALAPDGQVWVVNTESATVTVLQTNYLVADTLQLPRGSRPFGVVFDPAGEHAYVALEAAGKIFKLNATNGSLVAALNVGPHIRHLSVTADRTQILATRFVTPRVPGEDTANPQTTVANVKYGGEVLVIDRASFTHINTMILTHSEASDTSTSARGIPNYLGAAVIAPDGQSAWVPSKQDNIKRGLLRSGTPLNHDMSVRSIASRLNLTTQTEDLASRVDFDDGGIASAAAFDPQGVFLFVALEGSREVAVVDVVGHQVILRFDAGRAPQGLVLSPDGRTLFVHNFMDRTVTVHDLTTLAHGSQLPPPAPLVLHCVTTEQLSPTVLTGKQLFYDAADNRLALQQYLSCAACHNDGGQDGRIWDFTQFGEGLRNSISLRGHGGTAQGPLHWTGNFDEVQDFEGQIRGFATGTGLMSDTDFHAGTRSQPLGLPKAGLSPDLDALAAYVASLTANDDSPERNQDGSLTSAARAGHAVFVQQNCAQCHSGTQFTDSALNVFHDIGTLKPSSGQRLGAPLTGLDTPTLFGLANSAPYLHDGSAATLEAAITAHNGIALDPTKLANLVAFLRQLDDAGLPEATFGNTNNGAVTDGIGNGAINYARFEATSDLLVTKLHAKVEGVTGRYKTAIYGSSGALPGPLLRTSGEVTNPATGWQTFPLSAPLTLTNGQVYWLAIWSNADGSRVYYSDNTGLIRWQFLSYGTWPNSASAPNAGDYTYCIYAAGTLLPRQLNVTGLTAQDKVYDGTTTATLDTNAAALVGIAGGDVVALDASAATATFDSPEVGTAKPVQITGVNLSGLDAYNYSLAQPTTAATIIPRPVTPVIGANSKIYDGTTAATLSNQMLLGNIGLNQVTLGVGSAFFDSPAAGTNKIVLATNLSLTGPAATNYTLALPAATNVATIAPLGIVGSFTAADKTYDGTTDAFVETRNLSGVLPADAGGVELTGGTASFADTGAAPAKTVTLAGAGLTGSTADNYLLEAVTPATATISPALLVVAADDQNRTYGTTNPVFTASYSGFVGGETLATSGVMGQPDLSSPATNTSPAGDYPITAALGSLLAANYQFSFAPGILTVTPPGPVIITSVTRPDAQRTRLTGSGDAGVVYIVQTSTNIIHWQELGTVATDANGNFEFEDASTNELSHCFYRLLLP
jgi:YVTN family beta-propeller protein